MSDALPAPLAPQQPVCPERPRLRTLTIVESGEPVQYAAFCPWYEDLHFHGLPVVEGNGLIGLFSHLWGLPAGFVAVRLPEAVAYRTLDADARLAVAAAVDAWAALQAKRNAAR